MFLFAIWDGKAWISHAQPMENPKKIQNHPLLGGGQSAPPPVNEGLIERDRERWKDGQKETDRDRNRQIQIETDRDRKIETNRQTDRNIKIERDRERQIPGYTHTHQPSVYNVQQKMLEN